MIVIIDTASERIIQHTSIHSHTHTQSLHSISTASFKYNRDITQAFQSKKKMRYQIRLKYDSIR